jgi:hypothetical protein
MDQTITSFLNDLEHYSTTFRASASSTQSTVPGSQPVHKSCRVCASKTENGKTWSQCVNSCSPKMLDLSHPGVAAELAHIYPEDMSILTRRPDLRKVLSSPAGLSKGVRDEILQVMSMPISTRVIPPDVYQSKLEDLSKDQEFLDMLVRRLPMFNNRDRSIVERYLNKHRV